MRLRSLGARMMDRFRLTDRHGTRLELDLPVLETGRRAMGLSRARLDALLLETAEAAGVRVRMRQEAVRPILESGRVTGIVSRPVGAPDRSSEIRARVVVAADGRRSSLLRHLHPELGDPRRSDPGSWFGLKLHLRAPRVSTWDRVELHLFDGGYAGIGPVEEGRLNLCLLVTVRALRACGGSPERVMLERVMANPAAREALTGATASGAWKSVGPLRFGPRRPASHGALFVGDAAGTIDPFCGEGMSHALLAAQMAAPVVEQAAALGGLDDALAEHYTRRWQRTLTPVSRRVRGIGMLLGRPRLAGGALRLLTGPGRSFAPRLIAATRTARTVE